MEGEVPSTKFVYIYHNFWKDSNQNYFNFLKPNNNAIIWPNLILSTSGKFRPLLKAYIRCRKQGLFSRALKAKQKIRELSRTLKVANSNWTKVTVTHGPLATTVRLIWNCPFQSFSDITFSNFLIFSVHGPH